MKEAWSEDFIDFGETESFMNKDNNVNIYRCYPYPEGAAWSEMAIRICPFCAEPIEVLEEL
jgi:hypothetical protein